MQVSVEKLEGLERRMTVQVPAEKISEEVQSRLRDLCRRVRVDGFRPGKVPFRVVKRMFGPQVRQEVLGEVLQKSFQDALEQEQLMPAGLPNIEPKNMEDGENLEYSAVFEVFPEFELQGIENKKIERPLAEVAEADIDKMLETLRKQRTIWKDVERPSQLNDRVTISFEGKIDGNDFAGNKGDSVPVVLGEGAMLKDFEERLVGLQSGGEIAFDVTYPEDFPSVDLATKEVHFTVKVEAVSEPELPVVDDSFAESFDVKQDGLMGLRKALKQTMERELAAGVKAYVKRQVMQGLLDANEILVPRNMVKDEIEKLAKQMPVPQTDDQDSEAVKTKLFEQEAQRRVKLGLIVSQLITKNDIKLDNERVQAQLESLASSYQEEDAPAIMRVYQQNEQMMNEIRSVALEEQLVDWLLAYAEVADKPCSFDEVMRPEQTRGETSKEL